MERRPDAAEAARRFRAVRLLVGMSLGREISAREQSELLPDPDTGSAMSRAMPSRAVRRNFRSAAARRLPERARPGRPEVRATWKEHKRAAAWTCGLGIVERRGDSRLEGSLRRSGRSGRTEERALSSPRAPRP